MTRWRGLAVFFGVGTAAIAAAAGAADVAFDVKPGLWQVTMAGTTSGAPSVPPEALGNLSPQQRAQFAAILEAALARAARPHTTRSCITAEQLRRTPDFGGNAECKKSVVTRTARNVEFREVCTGVGADAATMSGTMHFTALDRQTVEGSAEIIRSAGGKQMQVKQKISGKWLGPDCGGVKPQGAR